MLVWYPEVDPRDGSYVRPSVRIESCAKSALDPNSSIAIRPYISEEAAGLDLAVVGVTTIEATRTVWDKIVIANGLHRRYERRGVLRQEGQRVSRHYYDLHCLLSSDVGKAALADTGLGADCVRHAHMFFDRPDYDLASAVPGTLAIAPTGAMIGALRLRLLKIGARVVEMAARIRKRFTSACSDAAFFRQLAGRSAAAGSYHQRGSRPKEVYADIGTRSAQRPGGVLTTFCC